MPIAPALDKSPVHKTSVWTAPRGVHGLRAPSVGNVGQHVLSSARSGFTVAASHAWAFRASFRRNAFGWNGTPKATERLKEAVGEIERVARTDPAMARIGFSKYASSKPMLDDAVRVSGTRHEAAALSSPASSDAAVACNPRCVRIFSMTGCSRIAAMIFSSPPQFGQC